MALIGNQIRQYSDRVVLDSLTASATADYTLQLNSTDFVPSSAESLTVSLNGIIQKPQDSYTVSGSTLTFASALTASDSIDFIIAERGITLQTPSAGSVGTSQLASSAVSTAKIADSAVTYAKSTGFGKVGQVVTATDSTARSTTSTSFVAGSNTLSVSITPTSTSSKVLVLLNANIQMTANNTGAVTVYRGSTNLGSSFGFGVSYSTATMSSGMAACYLDSPSTTSATTYEVRFKSFNGGTVYLNGSNNTANLTLMEILG